MTKNPNTYRIAFWGTPALTVPFLDMLYSQGFTPTVIITGEDKPQGRGMTITPPAPKVWATQHNVKVLQPKKLDEDFYKELEALNLDLSIVVAYGKIIKESMINLPKRGTINVHYSLLPKFRGATPVEAALLAGEEKTGIAVQQMVYELDAGTILATKEISILSTMRKKELFSILNNDAVEVLSHMLPDLLEGKIVGQEQNHTQATHCSKITKEDGEIVLGENDVANWNKWRAYEGWPGVYTFGFKNDQPIRVIIKDATFTNGIFTPTRVTPEGGKEVDFAVAKESILFKR